MVDYNNEIIIIINIFKFAYTLLLVFNHYLNNLLGNQMLEE